MNKMKSICLLVFLNFCLIGCKSEPNPISQIEPKVIDSFESALPHGHALESHELSDADKVKLGKAIGIQAESISLEVFESNLKSDSFGLSIYNFWDLECEPCLENIAAIKQLQSEAIDIPKFEVININIGNSAPEMVNSFIRENGLLDKVYSISIDTIPHWYSTVQVGWDGKLPALLIINNDDGTRLFYEKAFSYEELLAVILPLTF